MPRETRAGGTRSRRGPGPRGAMKHLVTMLALIGVVIIVSSLLSGALDRIAVPVVAVFLALGAVVGPAGVGLVEIGFTSRELTVIAPLSLALVLFTDAVTLNVRDLRERRRLLLRLPRPGTLVPAATLAVPAKVLHCVP